MKLHSHAIIITTEYLFVEIKFENCYTACMYPPAGLGDLVFKKRFLSGFFFFSCGSLNLLSQTCAWRKTLSEWSMETVEIIINKTEKSALSQGLLHWESMLSDQYHIPPPARSQRMTQEPSLRWPCQSPVTKPSCLKPQATAVSSPLSGNYV